MRRATIILACLAAGCTWSPAGPVLDASTRESLDASFAVVFESFDGDPAGDLFEAAFADIALDAALRAHDADDVFDELARLVDGRTAAEVIALADNLDPVVEIPLPADAADWLNDAN